jgi:hypothetical protein
MATETGIVWYWNGLSGWIKPIGVDNLPTVDARDIMILLADVSSGTVQQGSIVNFDRDEDNDQDWHAYNCVVQ